MHPQFYEACLTFVAAAMMTASVATRPERTRIHGLILCLMLSMMAWSGGVAASHAMSDPVRATAAAHFAFVGGFWVPPLWFLIAAHLTRLDAWLERPLRRAAVLAPSVLGVIALATNDYHGWLIRDSTTITSPSALWAGPLYWLWTAWAAALIFAGLALYLARSLRMSSRRERWRGIQLGATALLPLGATVMHNLGDSPESYDRTVLFAGVSICLLFFFDWRYRLLSMMPVARRDVIEQLTEDGVVLADLSGRIVDMNAAAERMIGASRTALHGRKLARAIVEQGAGRVELDEEAVQRALARLLDGGELKVRLEDFARRVFEIGGSTVRGVDGRPEGLYLTMREITAGLRMEELMRQHQRLESVASFTAGIAHEINNPLAYVRSNLALIHRSTSGLGICRPLDGQAEKQDVGPGLVELDELREVVEESIEGIDRIGRIVERVRRFSHLGEGEISRVALSRVVEDALRVISLSHEDRVEVSVDLQSDLPKVEASAEALTQALINLIVNASQALGADGGHIDVSARTEGGEIEIRVGDDGPGIPENLRERIFEPFFTTKSPGEGTGLGLAVTMGIAREHGGRVELDSPRSGGAVFTIRLPIERIRPT